MEKKSQSIITYKKKGKKITKTLHWYNKYIILNSIFIYQHSSYKISEGIEEIHFKNCDLTYISPIEELKGTCTFENCTFGSKNIKQGSLNLSGEKIKIINPNLINIDTIIITNKSTCSYNENNKLVYKHTGEATIIFDKKPQKKVEFLQIYADNATVINNDAISNLVINSNVILLKNDFNVERFEIKGQDISIIGDSSNTITIETEVTPSISAEKKLTIKNSKIKNIQKKENAVHLSFTELDIENFSIEAKKLIVYTNNDKKIYDINAPIKYQKTEDFKEHLHKSNLEQTNQETSTYQNSYVTQKKEISNESFETQTENINIGKKRR